MKDIKIYGFKNGDYVLPNEPLMIIEGSLDKVQIIETTLLNLTNYPTSIATLGIKLRTLIYEKGVDKIKMIEDGSCSGQSPFGSVLGVKYSFLGSVSSTSNLLASKLFDLDLYVPTPYLPSDFPITSEDYFIDNVDVLHLIKQHGDIDIYTSEMCSEVCRKLVPFNLNINNETFTFEVDENKLDNEVILFSLCCLILSNLTKFHVKEYVLILNNPVYITKVEQITLAWFTKLGLEVKNLYKNSFKIYVKYNSSMLQNSENSLFLSSEKVAGLILGPEFIVCSPQPALGMVYKIMEINGEPCIKFSEEKSKQTIPGFKTVLRLFDDEENILCDFLCLSDEAENYLHVNEAKA